MLNPHQTVHPVFFFNDTATTEIYPLSLHDALPISPTRSSILAPILRARTNSSAFQEQLGRGLRRITGIGSLSPSISRPTSRSRRPLPISPRIPLRPRSEEHTSELQSLTNLVCRLLL